jgi:hypothetical protein
MEKVDTLNPPMETSEEATPDELDLARKQGEAYAAAVHQMLKETQGRQKHVGDYIVAVAVEKAEGMYRLEDVTLKWENPGDTNVHIEVMVADGADGRFIPDLSVEVTVIDGNGNEIDTHAHEFVWHPWLFHYGHNWILPVSGSYTLQVQVAPPLFLRHDKKNGIRYYQPVLVEFENIPIEVGQKNG